MSIAEGLTCDLALQCFVLTYNTETRHTRALANTLEALGPGANTLAAVCSGLRVDRFGSARGLGGARERSAHHDEDEFDEWVALAANGPACVPSGSKRAEWLKARQD